MSATKRFLMALAAHPDASGSLGTHYCEDGRWRVALDSEEEFFFISPRAARRLAKQFLIFSSGLVDEETGNYASRLAGLLFAVSKDARHANRRKIVPTGRGHQE